MQSHVNSKLRALCSCFCLILCGIASAQEQSPTNDLRTVAEKSEYTATSLSHEVVEFVEQCDKIADWVHVFEFGRSVEQRPLLGVITGPDRDVSLRSERIRILVNANIHSGECAGKEAVLELLREISINENHAWLSDATILFVPNFNADGNDRVGKNEFHRPGQMGPANGMGTRENAQQLDLNRDFIKLTSPEVQALVALIDQFDPHLFMDLHTTNGSRHRYELTYDIPHNLNCPEGIRNYMRQKMMPEVTTKLAEVGRHAFYYGNFSQDRSRWTTYGHEPRFSTEYVGLRGRFAILSEAYSYIPYKQRIEASREFVRQCIDFTITHAEEIGQLIAAEQDELIDGAASDPHRFAVHMTQQARAFPDKVKIMGYDGESPSDIEVDFIADFESTRSVPLPFAYVMDQNLSRQVDRLRRHGIVVHQLLDEVTLDVSANILALVRHSNRPFQGHSMTSVEATPVVKEKQFSAGTYVVLTSQPLGRLAAFLLEPTSDDGLTTWNFFDKELASSDEFPVFRLEEPTEVNLRIAEKISRRGRLSIDMLVGNPSINRGVAEIEMPSWSADSNLYRTTWNSRPVLVDVSTGGMLPATRIQTWNEREVISSVRDLQIENPSDFVTATSRKILAESPRGIVFENRGRAVYYDFQDKVAIELSIDQESVELVEFSPDSQFAAFVRLGNLFVLDCRSRIIQSLTQEDGSKILSGKLDWVYQEELYGRGNFKGYWWSPDSRFIACLQLDISNTPTYTIVDDAQFDVIVEIDSYPLAGDPQAIPKVLVFDVAENRSVPVDLGNYENRHDKIVISFVSWEPNSIAVNVQVQNREQTELALLRVQADDGTSQPILLETTPAWIESPGAPKWLDDDSFLWLSPRTGKSQIFRVFRGGEQVQALTDFEFGILSILGYDPKAKRVFFEAKPDGIRNQIFSLDLNDDFTGGDIRLLTTGTRHHAAEFNRDFSYFFDTHSTISEPQQVDLRDANGTLVRTIVPKIDDRLEHLDINLPHFEKITLGGGSEKWETEAVFILPPDFDSSRQYPVLYHIYAGAQAPTVRDQYRGAWYLWHQMLAQHGYIIFMCDNRSASHYGVEQAWAVHRNLGEVELKDIEMVVTWLKSKPWIDPDRIGLWGWSYGGYMTAYAMTHSTSFKCGIAGAPVTDWRNYDSIYTERFMGLPQDNEDGYKRSSVVGAAANLHGRLLLIHGTMDDNVHLGNTLQLVYALQNEGKEFDLMLYPKNRHSITRESQIRHLRQLMTSFILKNL